MQNFTAGFSLLVAHFYDTPMYLSGIRNDISDFKIFENAWTRKFFVCVCDFLLIVLRRWIGLGAFTKWFYEIF